MVRYVPKVVAPAEPPLLALTVEVVVAAAAFENVRAVPPVPPAPIPTLTLATLPT
jgi:hypothetical protein